MNIEVYFQGAFGAHLRQSCSLYGMKKYDYLWTKLTQQDAILIKILRCDENHLESIVGSEQFDVFHFTQHNV